VSAIFTGIICHADQRRKIYRGCEVFERSSALNKLSVWEEKAVIFKSNSADLFVAKYAKFKLIKPQYFATLFLFK